MGKLFGGLKTEGTEETEDRVGGGFEAMPSDVYDATIKLAYVGKASSSDAMSITVMADVGGKEIRETIWITNRDGDNFYKDKQDPSKKRLLPGFITVDELCLLATESDLSEQDTETKTVKLYSFDERKEVPTEVEVLTALTGQTVKLAVLRKIEDKQKKDDSGKYVNTGETRTINTIDKVMHIDSKRTVNEYRREIEEPEFYEAWIAKNQNKDRNASKGAGGSSAGNSGSGKPGRAKKSLFSK